MTDLSSPGRNFVWKLRNKMAARFRFTQITFALMTTILTIFAMVASVNAAGRWPLFGLLFVTFIRILFIRRRIDVWMSAALVVATAAAALYLAEISGAPMGATLAMVTAVCTGVLVGLAFAQADTFLSDAGLNHSLHLTLDLSSLLRIFARLLPVLITFAILMPDLIRYARDNARFESVLDIFASDEDLNAASDSRQTSGIGSNLDASKGSSLLLDWSPALAVSWKNQDPSALSRAGIQYWRSHSLSQGFGLTWELASEDLVAAAPTTRPQSDVIAHVLLARRDELFLLHPSGAATIPLPGSVVSFMQLASGGGMLKSTTLSHNVRQVLYGLQETQKGLQPEPRPVHSSVPLEWQTKATDLHKQIFGPSFTPELTGTMAKPDQVAAKIREFYQSLNLSYSLNPGPLLKTVDQSSLESFLFDSKKGFCEHFAAATASLLRIAGVPARVVVGLASRVNKNETQLVLRRSDAHAWVEAWDQELRTWQTIDPTTWITKFDDLPSQQQGSLEWDHVFDQATAAFDALGLRIALALSASTNLADSSSVPSFLKPVAQLLERLLSNLIFVKIAILVIALALVSLCTTLIKRVLRRLPRRKIFQFLRQQPLLRRLARLERRSKASSRDSEDAMWSHRKLEEVQNTTALYRRPSQSVAEYLVTISKSKPIVESKLHRTVEAFNRLIYSHGPDNEIAKQHRAVIEDFILHLKKEKD